MVIMTHSSKLWQIYNHFPILWLCSWTLEGGEGRKETWIFQLSKQFPVIENWLHVAQTEICAHTDMEHQVKIIHLLLCFQWNAGSYKKLIKINSQRRGWPRLFHILPSWGSSCPCGRIPLPLLTKPAACPRGVEWGARVPSHFSGLCATFWAQPESARGPQVESDFTLATEIQRGKIQ